MGFLGKIVGALANVAQGAEDEFFVDALALAVACDGAVEQEEIAYAAHLMKLLPSSHGASEDEIHARLGRAFERLQARGWEASLAALGDAAKSRGCGRELLAAAVAVQYVDGVISEVEDDFIDALANAVGIDDDGVQDVIDDVEEHLGVLPDDGRPAQPLPHECRRCGGPVKGTFRGTICPYCEARLD